MATPFLYDTDHHGHNIGNAVLDGVKFAERTGSELVGQFYMNSGTLYFKNLSDVETPIHENSIVDISAIGPITASTTGRATQISIATASGTTNGIISIADYLLLTGATNANTASALVRRDASGNFSAGTITATNVTGLSSSPTGASSAASKSYVDTQLQELASNAIAGLDNKDSVRVAVDSNVDLATATAGTYDGVALAINDDLILVGQTDNTENGAYIITAGGLVRRPDSNSNADLTPGASYQVESGSYAQEIFTLVVARDYVLGTDPLAFLNISGINALIAGDGCEKDGQILHVRGTNGRVLVTADAVDISPNYAGQESIDTLGTVTTGTWEGTVLAKEFGGTGANTAEGAQEFLGIPKILEFTLGDGVAKTFSVTHNLNNLRVQTLGWYNGKAMGELSPDVTNANTISIEASLDGGATAIASNSLVVQVVGKKL